MSDTPKCMACHKEFPVMYRTITNITGHKYYICSELCEKHIRAAIPRDPDEQD